MTKMGIRVPGFSGFPIWGRSCTWEIFSSSLDHASKILYPSSSSWTSTANCLDTTLVTVPIKDYISKVRTILPRTRCCGGHVYPKHGKVTTTCGMCIPMPIHSTHRHGDQNLFITVCVLKKKKKYIYTYA